MMEKTKEIVLMGALTTLLLLGQVAMAALPNLEIVSLLVILYTLTFGRRVFFMIYAFVILEGVIYGFGLWWINYLYIWSILAAVTLFFRKQKSALFWSIVSGFFGILFGGLCAIPYLIMGGTASAFAYWVSGIFFDVLHCGGNFVLCLVLFNPLYAILQKGVKFRQKASFSG